MIRIRHILHPTDFSAFSTQAYLHAVSLAEAHCARLTMLHVCAPGFTPPEAAAAGPDGPSLRRQLEEIRPAEARFPVDLLVLDGDPAACIVETARDLGADLIVMGTHGRTGLERLFLGSVAEKVIRDAPCSVLVAKTPPAVRIEEPARVVVAANPA